jgi:hypothetical protein
MRQSAKLERQSLNTYATALHNFHGVHKPTTAGTLLFHNHRFPQQERTFSDTLRHNSFYQLYHYQSIYIFQCEYFTRTINYHWLTAAGAPCGAAEKHLFDAERLLAGTSYR